MPMSFLKLKSEFNFDAGIKLINEHLYAPSVHCLYYSVFQLMKVIINDYDGIKFENFDIEAKTLKETSHQFVIHKINNHVFEFNKDDYRLISSKIKKLKKLRTQADYDDCEILIDEAEEARMYADELRSKLREIFNQ